MAISLAPVGRATEIRPWVAPMVRLGYAAKGVIYLLMGTFAVRLAIGEGGRVTDSSGVLHTIVRQPFGSLVLTMIGVGILAYAAWHVAEAVLDTRHKGKSARGWWDRTLAIIRAGVYGGLGWEALQLVFARRAESQSADDYAREAMQLPFGRWFLALVGIGIAWYGVSQVWMAIQSRFDDDFDQRRLRAEGQSWVLGIGRAGVGARGVILVVMGFALVRAGLDRTPSKAAGTAESLWTLFAQPYPYGTLLLAAIAAGLVCYGFFQLLHARYARL
jgi:hypothetical protein